MTATAVQLQDVAEYPFDSEITLPYGKFILFCSGISLPCGILRTSDAAIACAAIALKTRSKHGGGACQGAIEMTPLHLRNTVKTRYQKPPI